MSNTDFYLKTEDSGRQVWHLPERLNEADEDFFASFDRTQKNSADIIYRQHRKRLPSPPPGDGTIDAKIKKALAFYTNLQTEAGFVPADYGGPLFLLPGLIIVSHISESPLPDTHRRLMAHYILNHQNSDGGWGLHIEGQSTMFGTVLHYVSLRLLGYAAEDPILKKAQTWIRQHGGAGYIPSWGKFYLAILGIYEWDGCHSLLPELWLLPKWLPFHPSRYWCHTRLVYLPMAYCYGQRLKAKPSALTAALRQELYTEPYLEIDWQNCKDLCAETDRYTAPSLLLRIVNRLTAGVEKILPPKLRTKALHLLLDYLRAEDEQTNYINLGPVNQVLNALCAYHAYGKESPYFQKHYARWFDYLWLAEDGLKMNGYNGSQLWDTTFALQALNESGFAAEFSNFRAKALAFVDRMQIRHPIKDGEKYYRRSPVGGWPFSTQENGWIVSDCTAEGLKVLVENRQYPVAQERLQQAVDLLLALQNKDGGWASYERTRGPKWLERLNPSEIFGNIMVEWSYTECTSAVLQSLIKFREYLPTYRNRKLTNAIAKGAKFIQREQRADGSWYGSWAVCFTYGTWFGVEGLLAAGLNGYSNTGDAAPEIKKACQFLVSKQNADGGWGESFESCLQKRYIPHQESHIVHTSWALLALLAANYPNKKIIQNGINYLLRRQLPNGDFPQQSICGVFNHSCGISYTSYRNIFPIWALSRFVQLSAKPATP